jgi:hypothetical protein
MTDEVENENEPEVSEESKPWSWGMRLAILVLAAAGSIFVAHLANLYADTALPRSIPAPYAKQLSDLNADRRELAKKRQDLDKEIAGLAAQEQWDCQRQGVIAGEALQSLKLDATEYVVNIDEMKIVYRRRR